MVRKNEGFMIKCPSCGRVAYREPIKHVEGCVDAGRIVASEPPQAIKGDARPTKHG